MVIFRDILGTRQKSSNVPDHPECKQEPRLLHLHTGRTSTEIDRHYEDLIAKPNYNLDLGSALIAEQPRI